MVLCTHGAPIEIGRGDQQYMPQKNTPSMCESSQPDIIIAGRCPTCIENRSIALLRAMTTT